MISQKRRKPPCELRDERQQYAYVCPMLRWSDVIWWVCTLQSNATQQISKVKKFGKYQCECVAMSAWLEGLRIFAVRSSISLVEVSLWSWSSILISIRVRAWPNLWPPFVVFFAWSDVFTNQNLRAMNGKFSFNKTTNINPKCRICFPYLYFVLFCLKLHWAGGDSITEKKFIRFCTLVLCFHRQVIGFNISNTAIAFTLFGRFSNLYFRSPSPTNTRQVKRSCVFWYFSSLSLCIPS